MNKLLNRLQRLRDERGFTMAYVMMFMLVGSVMAVAAWGSVNSDTRQTKSDKDSKTAYAAAESGLNWYLFRLNQDNAVWTDCDSPAALPDGTVNPVNQPWNGTGTDPRRWRNMPGNSGARFTIELLPANGTQCIPEAGAETSMLDSTGALTIRATGQFGNTKRTVVGQLRRAGFLDYLYFTDFETLDPVVFTVKGPANKANANCKVYRRNGRSSLCDDIVFAGGDNIKGPFHTNDNMLVCGSPTFGRTTADAIEVSDPAGYSPGCGGSASPIMTGTYTKGAPTLDMPATNASLKDVTLPAYRFTGVTRIELVSGGMKVTNAAAGLNGTTITPYPSNGVVYVDASCPSSPYDIVQDYNDPSCNGDVYVKGTYSKSLTIAAKRDVIVHDSILRNGNVVLGLIADMFVRVYHPVNPKTRTTQTCTSTNYATSGAAMAPFGPSPTNVRIDAAIMSVNHSFIVDNYYCGGTLGTLTVNGAIAQRLRGPVGTGGTSISTGYIKNYNYDDRFRVVNPPYFLDPVNSSWRMVRFNEQTPAT
jgi:hypothetical protein